jgi:hypothetical protein
MALSIPDVRSFRKADCDSDHCPAVAVSRESLSVSTREIQKIDVQYDLSKLIMKYGYNSFRSTFRKGLQLRRTQMTAWRSAPVGKVLEIISKSRSQRVKSI